MTKRTRLIILLICVACFFVGITIIIPYSLGYRFDFGKKEITKTGGIYVKAFPAPEEVIIDSIISQKPGLFSNEVFIQSLQSINHAVLVKKTGYYDYSKTIPVQEQQVTKLENILLFKTNIRLDVAGDKTQSPFETKEKYTIKTGNLYDGLTVVIKNITAFALQNNNIIWLGTDGFLYNSSQADLSATPTKLTETALKITKTGVYKIITDSKDIFVIDNKNLLMLNSKTNNLEVFDTPVNDAKISPDGKNIVYYDDKNIYLSPLPNTLAIKNTLYKSNEKINACLWLNNSYIVFSAGEKIIFSEIDYRGNINAVSLPQAYKNSQIYFNQQETKLYILTDKTLLVSERIIP